MELCKKEVSFMYFKGLNKMVLYRVLKSVGFCFT